MNVHYFQRYHQTENVATANTMLLLSRLYSYSPNLFFRFLREHLLEQIEFEPELFISLQEKGKGSVPDAAITQKSFKIVVETKLTDWFYSDQLVRHLNSFSKEEYKILVTLSSELMNEEKRTSINKQILLYNEEHHTHIVHVNTTFELLAQGIREVLSDRDFEMQDILDDYVDYCRTDGLISVSDAWKKMKMYRAGTTFEFNVANNLYYNDMRRGYAQHDYIGLYTNKSIRAIGKIEAIIAAADVKDETGITAERIYTVERGELTPERKELIEKAIEDGKRYGYELNENRYFFVEKFYETDYKKETKGAPMGPRMFDLTEQLHRDTLPEETAEIADLLRKETWE